MARYKRTAKWQKKLTVKELKHLAECSPTGKPNLESFKLNREAQKEMKAEYGREICFECRSIAIKLGMEA